MGTSRVSHFWRWPAASHAASRYPQKWRSYSRRCCATSRRKMTTRPSSSARAISQPRHSSRRITRAGSRLSRRRSVGCRPATPTKRWRLFFFGADILHVIINFQLWKDVVKALKAAPASYTGPNRESVRDRLLATVTSAAHALSPAQSCSPPSRPRQAAGKIRGKRKTRNVFRSQQNT